MYCHCILDKYPHVRHETTRALHDDAQREEEISDVGTLRPSSRKKRRTKLLYKELSIVEFENFTSAINGTFQKDGVELRRA